MFVEQPVPNDDVAGLQRVRTKIQPLVMADESCYTARDVVCLAEWEAADLVNLNVANAGGLHSAQRAATVAEAHGFSCLAGGMLELGVGAAASAHVTLATPAISYPTGILNRFAEHMLIADSDDWEPSGPRMTVPDQPGLSVTIDEDTLNRYCV